MKESKGIKGWQIIRLNKEDTELLEKYRERVSVNVDTKQVF
jgi:hypothetical protein